MIIQINTINNLILIDKYIAVEAFHFLTNSLFQNQDNDNLSKAAPENIMIPSSVTAELASSKIFNS
jgi:hypothetical protein